MIYKCECCGWKGTKPTVGITPIKRVSVTICPRCRRRVY